MLIRTFLNLTCVNLVDKTLLLAGNAFPWCKACLPYHLLTCWDWFLFIANWSKGRHKNYTGIKITQDPIRRSNFLASFWACSFMMCWTSKWTFRRVHSCLCSIRTCTCASLVSWSWLFWKVILLHVWYIFRHRIQYWLGGGTDHLLLPFWSLPCPLYPCNYCPQVVQGQCDSKTTSISFSFWYFYLKFTCNTLHVLRSTNYDL